MEQRFLGGCRVAFDIEPNHRAFSSEQLTETTGREIGLQFAVLPCEKMLLHAMRSLSSDLGLPLDVSVSRRHWRTYHHACEV